jgi:CPA2 family monovalent cation:H+ antiporter-2
VAVLLAVLGIAFWRAAAGLQGHVRAGAQAIVEALARQARPGDAKGGPDGQVDPLEKVRALLPGIGEPVAVRLEPASPGAGRTLAALDLRGLTGATVLAIWRQDGGVLVPGAKEVLRPGDVLALAGTAEAVEAARRLLLDPAAGRASGPAPALDAG